MKIRNDFNAALRSLRAVKAPDSLAPGVYDRLGLRDSFVRMGTEIGDVYVAYGKGGVVAVRRARDDAAYAAWHSREFGRAPTREKKPDASLLDRLRKNLAGKRAPRVRVDLRGLSAFQRAVLEKAREIPRGEVRPYAWLAKQIGRPRAVRAVGSALAKNPVPLLIPCHRVVRSDGSVGHYIFGSPAKRALLTFEGAHFH
jgi:methylated-DNA-[protein]-cysteine S-methyltransferase